MSDRAVRGLLGMRPRPVVTPRADRPMLIQRATSAVVVGGGIAGVSAALVLAERGVRVTLLEAAGQLGGRLGAWPRTLPDGTVQQVEHGFHGFFRHYYTWRSVLRRIDPELGFLRPLPGYPVISRAWPAEDFASLPALPPVNLLALLARSPSLRLRDLRQVDRVAAATLLEFDRTRTYAQLDGVTATELLDRLGLPDRARAMLFEVFGHSFFNREAEFSAAELVMMFHFYFLANPEGLGLDVTADDHGSSVWSPLGRLLARLGVDVRTGTAVDRLERTAAGWRTVASGESTVDAEHAVVAVDPAALRRIAAASAGLPAPLARQVAGLTVSAPYAVARFWTDRPVHRGPAGVLRGVPGTDARLDHRLLATRGRRPAVGRPDRRRGRRAARVRDRRRADRGRRGESSCGRSWADCGRRRPGCGCCTGRPGSGTTRPASRRARTAAGRACAPATRRCCWPATGSGSRSPRR